MGDPLDANQYVQQAIIQLVRSSVNQKLAISGERGLVKGVAGRIFQQLQVAATGINNPVETLFAFPIVPLIFPLFFLELAPASLQPNFPFIEHFSELAPWQIWQSYAATNELNVYTVGGRRGRASKRGHTRIITHTSRCLTCISIWAGCGRGA